MNEAVGGANVLGQVMHEGQWLDYARGTKAEVQAWVESEDYCEARGVDWIDKGRVVVRPKGIEVAMSLLDGDAWDFVMEGVRDGGLTKDQADTMLCVRFYEDRVIGECIVPPCRHCGRQVYDDDTLRQAAEGLVRLDTTPTHMCG